MREFILLLAAMIVLWIYSRLVIYYTYSARDDSAEKKTQPDDDKPHSEKQEWKT